jgi:NAD(P)H-hydrate repair Nnr-like enzyme with NAD(P)H-hydrate dehydratase domain
MTPPLLPPRPHDSHKGQLGHIGIVGGAPGRVGAALLAGRAALQCGAGLVTLGVLDAAVRVDFNAPELTFMQTVSLHP